MTARYFLLSIPLAAAFAASALAAAEPNPAIQKIISEISGERIAASMRSLEDFGTRHILSEQDHARRGIGAARRWLEQELRSYSPRLQVSSETFAVKKTPRVVRDAQLTNIVAMLPGKTDRDRCVVISAHYDSLALVRKKGARPDDMNGVDWEASAAAAAAPGVVDDGSGTAAVLEMARVMSGYEFDKSILFVLFSGEEMGLLGSKDYAKKARARKLDIEAVLNNDIIGSDVSGNGHAANNVVHVFSVDPVDSPSRALARYVKDTAERYVPAMTAELVFRSDRFARNGDQFSFQEEGFAAVRLTTPAEFFAHQHSVSDTFANASPAYTAQVTRVNAAALASLALAPRAPVVTRRLEREGTTRTVANLARGKSGYDAVLRWSQAGPAPDLAGYAVVIRSTTSPLWEREIWVGNVTEYTIPDLSIDDVVIGVKAVDKDGNASLVSAYVQGALGDGRSSAESN